ncbi:energy transducer TonB [Chryseobacterium gleum]|uniref:energy transducer TonB n=1 Tax=Chryseobacterium gleum TaxID=250 RepID=UPI001E4FB74F|nr:energy transducer TonB [Chryseobacterium gleum]MCD9618318.1 energy transducer TonB [Chryseobacterium gleum]
MKKIAAFILCLGFGLAFSQKYTLPDHGIFKQKTPVRKPAQYPGGISLFVQDVTKEIKTNRIISSKDEKAQSNANFYINTQGEIEKIVVTGSNKSLNKEIERVLKSMKTKWTPGELDGKPISVPYNVPFTVNFE